MIVPGAFDRFLLLAGGYWLVLTPIVLLLVPILYLAMRRLDRPDPLSRRTHAAVALLIAYPAALALLFVLAQLSPTRAAAVGLVGGPLRLVSLYSACGGRHGARLLVLHWRDPEFGRCGLCDDTGGRPAEYRRLFCPEFGGQPDVWGNR